eukprot:GHRR01028515.1.p1 GENE.GHRR01028515.1~~GHRR01028515.1.p1  ORF type:complete len:179 (+),score=39.07 GHRR01028515.1:162-698(+)
MQAGCCAPMQCQGYCMYGASVHAGVATWSVRGLLDFNMAFARFPAALPASAGAYPPDPPGASFTLLKEGDAWLDEEHNLLVAVERMVPCAEPLVRGPGGLLLIAKATDCCRTRPSKCHPSLTSLQFAIDRQMCLPLLLVTRQRALVPLACTDCKCTLVPSDPLLVSAAMIAECTFQCY